MDELANLIVVTVSQHIRVSEYDLVHLKFTQCCVLIISQRASWKRIIMMTQWDYISHIISPVTKCLVPNKHSMMLAVALFLLTCLLRNNLRVVRCTNLSPVNFFFLALYISAPLYPYVATPTSRYGTFIAQ